MIRIRLPLPHARPLFDTICSGINDRQGETMSNNLILFGLGDASAYPDTFVDGLGILHEVIAQAGAMRIGYWPTDGYAFEASRAIVGGRFAGLVLDEASQSHLTGERLARWVQEMQVSA